MSGEADVFIRVVPPEFRRAGYSVVRNNVYQLVQGENGPVRQLVGQLTEGPPTRLPVEQAARLFGGGGQAALTALSAIGSVASIATLGVCVLGFLHVSRALKRVESRLEGVEQKLEVVAGLVGVIDQKVDQLVWRSDLQLEALADIRGLLLSFQTARVHRALETLDLRSKMPATVRRDSELMEAARALHEYRTWLTQVRESKASHPATIRTELLRAEVLVAMAEARARILADDAEFASLELERTLAATRVEVARMREAVVQARGVPSLLSCYVADVDLHTESASIWSWLDRRSAGRSTRELLRESTSGYNDLAQRLGTIRLAGTVNDIGLVSVPRVSDSDAASLVAAYRLARSLEPALTLSTAVAVAGPQVRPLLLGPGDISAPALVVECEQVLV